MHNKLSNWIRKLAKCLGMRPLLFPVLSTPLCHTCSRKLRGQRWNTEHMANRSQRISLQDPTTLRKRYSRVDRVRGGGGLHLDSLLNVFLRVERQRTVILLVNYTAWQLCAGCGGEVLLRLLDMLQGTSNLKGRDRVTLYPCHGGSETGRVRKNRQITIMHRGGIFFIEFSRSYLYIL